MPDSDWSDRMKSKPSEDPTTLKCSTPDLIEEFETNAPPADQRPFQDWDKYIDPGERIVWEGFPQREDSNERLEQLFIATAAVAGIIGAALIAASVFENTGGLIALALGAGLCLLSALAYVLRERLTAKIGTQRMYAISTKFALIITLKPKRHVWRFPLSLIRDVKLYKGQTDCVLFAGRFHGEDRLRSPWEGLNKNHMRAFSRHWLEERGFDYLSDGTEPYRILTEMSDKSR